MTENTMLQEAVEAIRQGQRNRARDLLTRLLKTDQSNPEYWLWMSTVVDSVKEQVYCLNSVLGLDPENLAAKRGLVLLGAVPPEAGVTPAPPVRRKWETTLETAERPRNPLRRIGTFAAVVLAAGGVILFLIFGRGKEAEQTVAARPTHTEGPAATFTATPTFVNATSEPTRRAIVPTEDVRPTPLWMLLEATYTPTPVYINTPHPASEAYRVAVRNYERGQWQAALDSLDQALRMEPKAADILYFQGEIYRQQGEYEEALDAYEAALKVDPNFAPAYLGRAQVERVLRPKSDVGKDLDQAIKKDPSYVEAYLEKADYLLEAGEAKEALKLLDTVEAVIPDSPLLFLYRAQAHLELGQAEAALEAAQQAKALDMTLLPAYLAIGQAALAGGEIEPGLEALSLYVEYVENDAQAWAALGGAYYETGKYKQAQAALEKALKLDRNLPEAFLYRGLTRLELGEGQPAVNDLWQAHQWKPRDFQISLALGRALLDAGRLKEARDVVSSCEKLAESDEQMAAVYYWRARSIEAIGNHPTALLDWKALVKLPKKAVPAEWRAEAEDAIKRTPTPTVTATPTATRTPTATATATATKKPTVTATPTATKKATVTVTATATPTKKATAAPTATKRATATP